eukprot:TRINITY_DN31756_c0_g1_i1.p1 TRINITY_DN31756_c0_g1~~TRINITY_DN31756_c0_g1_i1.p1  ORF type:complete len:518 (+),score=127.32 TRINITY_DN31756_c0_g1_i1:129-1682(+)
MNRVTEGNLDPSCRELNSVLAKVVPEAGSSAAADALTKMLLPAAVSDPHISVLVLGCYAALATAAHVLYGAAFGGSALLQASEMLKGKLKTAELEEDFSGIDAQVAKSCVIFKMLLFSFGLIPGSVVFDVVRFIMGGGSITEVRVELALTVLRYSGRTLRSECPDDFREVLKFVTAEASRAREKETEEGSEIQSRLDFLLRELNDLKNNKVSFAVMDRFDQTRTWLQTAPVLSGKKVKDHQLAVPFRLFQDEAPPNWPVSNSVSSTSRANGRAPGKANSSSQDPLRAAAVAQRLSTELRQSLYVALMGAEDVEDAAERLSLVAASAKIGTAEACIVLFHCAVREKVPNPFHTHVAIALCKRPAPQGKRFSHCIKRAAVQQMQQGHTYGMRAAVCLAELCAALMASSVVELPLSIVRFMRFGEADAGRSSEGGGKNLGGALGLLLRHMTESLLKRLTDVEQTAAVFGSLKKYEDVREGLLFVVDGLVKPRLPPQKQAPELWAKLRAARKQVASNAFSH